MVRNWILSLLLTGILTPHFVWGLSLERTQKYKEIVLSQKLFLSPQWLRLGHYHKSWSSSYHSQIKGNFFIAPDGADNPQSEFLATIDALFTDTPLTDKKNSLQCRYLARTRWLKSVLPLAPEDLASCPIRDQWKQQLDSHEAYIIFASSDLNSPGSSFGHTFLRLHNPKNTHELELLDYGVNYAALTGQDSGALFALKGLFGFYPGSYSMLPYHQKIREYTNLEGRDIWEYKLKLSEEEVALLIDHLLELDGSFSYYYFSDENCSYQILELLNVLRPELDLTKSFHDFVIPLDTLRILSKQDFLSDERSRPSLQAEWRSRFAGLNLTEKKELKDAVNSPQTFQFTTDLTNKEKAETLEASLSYLAIKEFREQKNFKEDKYSLAVQRSKLGPITEPIVIPKPSPPLLSQNDMGLYLGFGQENRKDYLDLKFRRAFHDLLSGDGGLSPFFHLEVLSFEFRYFTEKKNLELSHWTLLNVLATAPSNILDHPLSWTLDMGTSPKLAPYFDFGGGSSLDLSSQTPTRWVILGRSENRTENEKYAGYLGVENILMTKWTDKLRSVLDARYLYSFQERGFLWDQQVGISFSHKASEIRLEYNNLKHLSDWRLAYIYFF
jgi:hypothetical protein